MWCVLKCKFVAEMARTRQSVFELKDCCSYLRGNETVAKPPQLPHAARRPSHNPSHSVTAVWRREGAVDASSSSFFTLSQHWDVVVMTISSPWTFVVFVVTAVSWDCSLRWGHFSDAPRRPRKSTKRPPPASCDGHESRRWRKVR